MTTQSGDSSPPSGAGSEALRNGGRLLGFALAVLLLSCSPRQQGPAPPSALAPSPSPTAAVRSALGAGPAPALAALRQGDLPRARKLARQAAQARPEDGAAHRIVSEVEFAAGNYDAAQEAAREALRLSGEDDPRALLTAVKSESFTDPEAALAMARKLAAVGGNDLPNRILVADLLLYQASAAGRRGADAEPVAREAREVLGDPGPVLEDKSLGGDFEAVLANSYLLENDLQMAAEHFKKALQLGAGMPDRLTDLADALAWVSFLAGDEEGVERSYDRALTILRNAPVEDAFQFLPKWESFLLLRLAFAGTPTGVEEMHTLDPLRKELARRGFDDQVSFRMDRQLYTALADAAERGDYGQAFYLLAWKTLPLPEDPDADPYGPLLMGEERIEPACFYRLTVVVPAQELFRPMFLARVAEKAGRPDLARYWYEVALEKLPGNAIIKARLAALPAGKPPEDLGAPGAAATLRILQRLAQNGWSAPLFDGVQAFQARGVTLAEFDRMAQEGLEPFLRLSAALDGAVETLDDGTPVPEDPLPSPVPEEEWTERAEVVLPGGRTLILHKEDRLWVLSGPPPLSQGQD